jgi:hypothetical protein
MLISSSDVRSLRAFEQAGEVRAMPNAKDEPSGPRPPKWALHQAGEEADVGEDASATMQRAQRIAHDAEALQAERHDEYDDPDAGGEG